MSRRNPQPFVLRVFLVAFALCLSTALPAATFDVLVDKDNNAATGCTMATADGPFSGIEYIIRTSVDTTVYPPVVSGVTQLECAAAPSTYSPPVTIDVGGWPVGIGNGVAGYDVLETYFRVVSPYGQYRLGFVYNDPNTGADALITANGQVGGAALVFDLGPLPVIPTLAHGALLLLAFGLAWLALTRLRRHKVSTLVLCGVLASIVAGTVWAQIILDGLINDWTGVPQLSGDATGDAPGGADMSAIFVKLEGSTLFVRADVKTASPPSFTSAAATTFTVGTAGNFAITTFGIPAVDNITQGGTLPAGVNFVYTAGQSTAALAGIPGPGTGGVYPLTFTATNGVPPPGAQNFTLTINQAPALTSAGNTTFIVGTPGSFTVTTTGFPAPALTLTGCSPALPGGLVFTDNGNGTATLAGPAALGSVGVKNCTLTASNGVGAPATQPFALTINQAPSTTALTSDVNPSLIGQPVTFTATVTATPPGSGTPTGQVQFKDAGNPLGGPVTLTGGVATFSTSSLALGAHSITVDYLGDADFVVSTGSLPTQTVTKAQTTTAVTSSVNPSVFGQAVTFTATVTATPPGSGIPTGTVTFSIDGNPQAPVALVAGVASLPPTATLTTGAHSVTATYGSDANFDASTGGLPTQTVNKAATTTVLGTTPNPSVYGQPVTLTATVTASAPGAGIPTGTVNFFDGATNIGSGPLVAGVATLATTTLTTNAHMLSAQYAGDGDFNTSTSNIIGQTVNPAATTTTVLSSANPAVFSQPVTFTATVAPVAPGAGTPTGTVTFTVDGNPLCSAVALSGGSAVCATSTLAVGAHPVSVAYSGETNFLSSSSGTLSQAIDPAATTTVLDPGPATVFGQSATLTATVSITAPGTATPTGTVDFKEGATTLGSGTLNGSGVATLSLASLPAGSHGLTAVYVGTASFNTSSGAANKVVNPTSTTTALGSNSNPSLSGGSVTFTATVAAVAPGAGTPTGSVQFKDGLANLGGAVPLAGGQAQLTTAALSPGVHGITAVYGGDANFSGSTSAAVNQTVNEAPLFTSANTTTFNVGAPGSYPITASGFPAPTLSAGTCTPALPAGVSFAGSGTATMTLQGTPPIGSGNSYVCNLTAANGIGSDANQSFTLLIDEGPTAVADPVTAADYQILHGTTLTVPGMGMPPLPALLGNDSLGFPAATLTSFGGGDVSALVTDNAAGTPVMFGPGHVLQVNADGSFTFTPASNSYGEVSFDYRLTNSTGSSDATVTLGILKAPLFTSAATASFQPGLPGTFTVTTSGFPAPAITTGVFSPAAPWLSLTDNGDGTATLAGTPPAMATGSITFTLTATNSIAPAATQNFTLQLQSPPAIISANAATFQTTVPGTFTVTTTGFPTGPSMAITKTGTLPAGTIALTNNNDGTATLAGTANAGQGGVYALVITADNGVPPAANQNFTLTVNDAPGTPSGPTPVTFVVGTLNTATYTATGYPAPTFTLTGCPGLPPAITLSTSGLLSGTAVAGTGGDYNCTVTASNGIGSNSTLPIVVQVREAPAFTSAATLTCQTGNPCTLSVTASGFPAPTLTAGVCTPALPAPVAFTGSGTTSMSLGGTPPANGGGSYSCALTASNGVGSTANQTLVITINQPPAITSASSTVFTEGQPGSFTVTTTGFPTNASMSIGQTGTLPAGTVTFTNNNNGTATLAGTPNLGSAGLYPLVITASNGIGSPATQNPFNLRVCPVITMGGVTQPTRTNAYTATVLATGGTGPYTYAITAAPSPITGTTLGSNGVFTGTVTASGPYNITITATDSIGCTGATSFAGTINEPPAVTGESYQVVGNTPLRVAASDGITVPHLYVSSSNGVLGNDNNGNGGGPGVGITAVAGTFATTGGGSITLAADGTFTYTPAVNFTGADTYVYTVSDGIGTATGTLTLNVSTKIWYVKNDVALTGNGSAGAPFKTLAETVTPSAVNDTIYIFAGDGTTTGQNAGIVLENGQRLIGQGTALTAAGTFNIVANPTLQAAGSAPTIGNSGGNGITLASGNTIRGLTVGATTGTKIFGTAFGTLIVGNTTTPDVALTGAGKLLDLTNGTFDATSAFSSIASTSSAAGQHGLKLDTVHGTVAFGSTTITNPGIQGIFVFNSDANVNFGNTVVGTVGAAGSGGGPGAEGIRFESNTGGTRTFGTLAISESTAQGITIAGVGIGGGQTVVTGQTTITNPGNVGIFISGAAAGHGATFADVIVTSSAGVGVRLVDNLGAMTFADLDLSPDSSHKALVSTFTVAGTPGMLTTTSGTISALANTAVEITSTGTRQPLAMALDSVSSTGGVNNVLLTNVSGSLAMNAGALSASSAAAFNVSGSTATVTYDGSIANTTGGISLIGNTGGTITFRGGMVLSTGANPAFTATGGGTVNVCDENPCNPAATGALVNTLTTTTGTALNVANTTIGANKLEFRSIAANGGTNGILLQNTGAGGLTVSGTGGAGTGGTIQNTTTRGASFITASNISLKSMNFTNAATNDFPAGPTGLSLGVNTADNAAIHFETVFNVTLDGISINGSAEHGINGHNVTNFVLKNSSIVNAGNGPDEDGIHFFNMLGTCEITNTTITSSGDDNVNIQNNTNLALPAGMSAATTLTITGGGANTGVQGSGYLMGIRGTSNTTVTIDGVTANNNFSGGIVIDTFDTATSVIEIKNSSSTNNNDGIQISSKDGSTKFDIHDNVSFAGNDFVRINILKAAFSTVGTLQGKIRNNPIVVTDGQTTDGIIVFQAGDGTLTVSITDNTVVYRGTQRAIFVQGGQDGSGQLNATITGNAIDLQLDGTGNAAAGIIAQVAVASPSGDNTNMCADIGGAGALKNVFTHSLGNNIGAGDIRVRQRFATTVTLPGYVGAADDEAAVVAYLTGRNTLVNSPTATSTNGIDAGDPGAGGFVNGAACPLPVFP